MEDVPQFRRFGDGDLSVSASIQPAMPLRGWDALTTAEKSIVWQQLANTGWARDDSEEVLSAIEQLNSDFLRACPGKNLHATRALRSSSGQITNQDKRIRAASVDFMSIMLGASEALVLRAVTELAACHIDQDWLRMAAASADATKRAEFLGRAFKKFDRLANCLNHIFEQFSVNWRMTRAGLVPMQDEKITAELYVPTLRALSDPKWREVSSDLARVFQDFSEGNFSEAITKVHAATQRFLQILVGEDFANGKGEVAKLFSTAKAKKLIPANRFSEQFINGVQSSIVAERATNSTAKPAKQEASATDALLAMNLVMVFIQHCLVR
jgi:hypothetical protein